MDKIELSNIKLIKKDVIKEWLKSNGFCYNRIFSDEENESYSIRFPVYKYVNATTLECELIITLGKDEVNVDVYSYETREIYEPFYYYEYGNYEKLLKVIWKNIDDKLRQLGITKVVNKNKK